MNRRDSLRSLASVGAVAAAGCLGALGRSGGEETVLGPPEQDLSEASHPSYGDDLPAISLPDPILGETIATADFEGERAILLTFFYTSCPDGVCPALILRLRRAQEASVQNGYEDDAAFLPITFDPERDTAEVLETYASEQGIHLDVGNWHFLRPESYESGQTLIKEEFGLVVEKAPADDYETLEYRFPHYGVILLVNKQGVVERAYPNGMGVDIERVVTDFEQVTTA